MIPTTLTVLAFSAVLYYTYKWKVAPFYAYSGLRFRQPDPFYYALVTAMVVLIGLMLPHRINRVSDTALWLLFVFSVSPSMLLAQYSPTLSQGAAVRMSAAIAASMIMIIVLTRISPRFRIPVRRSQVGMNFWVALLVFSAVVYTYLLIAVGLKLELLAFNEVYSTRADFKLRSAGIPAIGYVLAIQANVVNPLFFVRGIYARRSIPLALGCLGQVLIYTTTGHKSVLFSVVAMTGAALMFRAFRRPPGVMVVLAITAASTSALLVDRLAGSVIWTSLISRRVMIVPGALTAAYVSTFQNKPRMHFADALPFVSDPYGGASTVRMVGAEFVGNAGTAANVNIFGHGYLNAGYLGMFIEGLVLVGLLTVANAASRGLPTAVASIVFLAPVLALGSASVFTTAGTHGFLAAIVLCAVAPGRRWASKKADASRKLTRARRRVRGVEGGGGSANPSRTRNIEDLSLASPAVGDRASGAPSPGTSTPEDRRLR